MTPSLSKRLSLSACAALIASLALAQTQPGSQGYVAGGTYSGPNYQQPYYGGGGYGGFGMWPGYGGTAAGSYLSGMASAIRASGQYNALSAEAAVNLEEARKRDIENRVSWTNAYFEMRKINQAYVDSRRSPRLPTEEWARLAQQQAPARLTSHTLDPVNGEINWPVALQSNDFKTERDQLQTLFAERADKHGAIGPELHAQIRTAVDSTLAKLKERIRDFNTNSYLEARNFLASLAREADFPAG